MRRSALSRHIHRLVLLVGWAAPLLYVFLALIKIRYPGIHFDEMLHVNAALGGLDDTFMYRSLWLPLVGRVPVLLMTYIGALKAWVTAPVFALLGVSVLTVRVPMIVLTAISLRILHGTLCRWQNPTIASLVVLLLSVDPTVLSLTRADSGPVALQFFFTVIALWAFERYLRKHRYGYLVVLFGALGLGIFNKLNFVWVLNAFVATAVLVYGKKIYRSLRDSILNKRLHLLTWALGVGAMLGYYLLLSYKFSLGGFLDLAKLSPSTRLENIWVSLRGILAGQLFYNYGLGELHVAGQSLIIALLILIVLTALALVVFSSRARVRAGRTYAFFWLLCIFTLVQIAVTRNAVWPWHYFALYPAVTILIVLSVRVLAARFGKFVWGVLPLLVLFSLVTYGQYIGNYGEPTKNAYWSPAIYQLIEATRDDRFTYVSLDWGTHTQLLGFSQDASRFKNASFFMNRNPLPSDARSTFTQSYLQGGDLAGRPARFILHAPDKTLFTSARKNFFDLVGGPAGVDLVEIIYNGTQPLFELYDLDEQ